MASVEKQIISLGLEDDFIMYMFKDDIDMFKEFKQESRGILRGLWTNTRNPVVHIVHLQEQFPEPYKALNSQQWKDKNNLEKVVTMIGCWSFRKSLDENRQFMESDEVFYLDVTECDGALTFNPFRYSKGKLCPGKIETLSRENPFKLSENELRLNEEDSREKSDGKFVAGIVNFFEDKVQQGRKLTESFSSDKTKSNQWYLSDKGNKLLNQIYETLNGETDKKAEIKRVEQTLHVFLIFTFHGNKAVLYFPEHFPEYPATLYKMDTNNDMQKVTEIEHKEPKRLVETIINALF